jgi:hypothetical protein
MKIIDLRENQDCDTFMVGDLKPCFDYLINLGKQKACWWIRLYFWFWKRLSKNKEVVFTQKNICLMLMKGLTDTHCKFLKKVGIHFEYRKYGNNNKLCGVV